MRQVAFLALVLVFPSIRTASAQSVISARSGLVNFLEGVVFLDGQPLARKAGAFARMRDGSTLLTESGRVEVLLTPDTYLRIGENSSIRMISGSISDTQVELLSGSAIVDSSKAPAGDFVRVIFRDAIIRLLKPGHYRIDAEPPQLRVYQGESEVARDGKTAKLESSQLLPLDGSSVVKRFTQGSDGLLDLWSEERGELIASKMVSAGSITDPLLDSGPGVPADFASYIGYVPLTTMAATPAGGFGYGYLPSIYAGPAFYPGGLYPSIAVAAFAPFPRASFLYVPRRYTPILTGRPALSGRPSFSGTAGAPSRTIFVPRPTLTTAPPVRAGGPVGVRPVHPGGRR